MMKKTMKKPMKKADGGEIVRNPPALGIPTKKRMPEPNHHAMEHANERARFKRPEAGGPMQPMRPGMPAMPRAMNAAGIMPMRKAKGGSASKEKWIQGAIKEKGALRSALGAKKGEPIPAGKLEKATHSKNPKMAKRANLAMTLRGMKKK